jgi:isoleucyl-tRNA synthetase
LPFLNVLWNTHQFYLQLNPKEKAVEKIEDKWVISKMNSLIKETTKALESYQIEKALNPIFDFVVNDFSKKYIKMVRNREDKNVKEVIGKILDALSKLLAPYAPNITEVIHKEFGKSTIHLCEWPKYDEKLINKKLEENFEMVYSLIEKGLAERDKEKIGLKWPLAKATITYPQKMGKEFEEIIKNQLNIKKIEWSETKTDACEVKLDTKVTPDLEAEGYARELSRQIQAFRKELGLEKKDNIKLQIISEKDFVKMLEKQKKFIQERTNAKELDIVTTAKEKFKKRLEFNIRGKRGEILVEYKK